MDCPKDPLVSPVSLARNEFPEDFNCPGECWNPDPIMRMEHS